MESTAQNSRSAIRSGYRSQHRSSSSDRVGTRTIFGTSRTWVSPEQQENERFQYIMSSAKRHFEASPFIPRERSEWVEHRAVVIAAAAAWHNRKLERRQRMRVEKAYGREFPQLGVPYGDRTFTECRGAVLCQQTIWCTNWSSSGYDSRVAALWPCNQEWKWEGEDRARTDVGRFMPLPRVTGNETVAWHVLPLVQIWPFDQVRKIPDLEDIYFPVDDIPNEIVPSLLNSDLLEEINGGGLLGEVLKKQHPIANAVT